MNLAKFPRRRYTEGQTPIEKLSNLSKAPGGPTFYIKRAEEIMTQMFEKSLRIDRVVCASGSTGTHAGLVTGFHGNNGNIRVIGVNVSRKEEILDKSKLEV